MTQQNEITIAGSMKVFRTDTFYVHYFTNSDHLAMEDYLKSNLPPKTARIIYPPA